VGLGPAAGFWGWVAEGAAHELNLAARCPSTGGFTPEPEGRWVPDRTKIRPRPCRSDYPPPRKEHIEFTDML